MHKACIQLPKWSHIVHVNVWLYPFSSGRIMTTEELPQLLYDGIHDRFAVDVRQY